MKITLEIIYLLLLSTLIHEGGHIITLRLFKVRIKRIQIFMLNLVEFNFNSFHLAIGLLPVGGYTLPHFGDFIQRSMGKRMLMISAGILANSIAGSIGYLIYKSTGSAFWFDFTWLNFLKAAVNLIPMGGSDGNKLIKIKH